MNLIFGLILSVLVVHGSEESCQESRQLEFTCGNYCFRVVKPMLDYTKALKRQMTDFAHEKPFLLELENTKKFLEAKFDLQDNTIQHKFRDLSSASDQIMQQIKLQGKQVEQQLEHLHKVEEVMKQIPGPPYQQIGSKYYYIEESEELNWFGAVNKCLNLGGHLISIENLDEFNAIKKKLRTVKDYWIDLNDLNKEGEFTSISTGRRANYFMWAPSEPNNLDKNEDCGELNSVHEYQMNDDTCSKEQLFICEFRN